MSRIYLTRLVLKNFRKFEHLEINFTAPNGKRSLYHVLAGPNGCGKTTVLEAIEWAAYPRGLVKSNARMDIALPRRESDLWGERHVSSYWYDSATGTTFAAHILPDGYVYPVDVFDDGTEEWEAQRERFESNPLRFITSRRTPVLKGGIRDSMKPPSHKDDESNAIVFLKLRIRQQQGRRVPGYRGPEPKDRLWLEKLNAFWKIFRNDGTEFVLTLVDPDNLDASEWDLFLYRGDYRICSVDHLSSGELEVISLCAPFIVDDFEGLLLIDEPELHLHPEWQARIMPALRELLPTSQIIVATHADDPWEQAMSWERTLLVPPDDPRAKLFAPRQGTDGGDAA